ncbi:hypothetical protein CF319_g4112 [Tilletia indica]|nr:hypothetical protein CF319_g4112 [Tilletia indica]
MCLLPSVGAALSLRPRSPLAVQWVQSSPRPTTLKPVTSAAQTGSDSLPLVEVLMPKNADQDASVTISELNRSDTASGLILITCALSPAHSSFSIGLSLETQTCWLFSAVNQEGESLERSLSTDGTGSIPARLLIAPPIGHDVLLARLRPMHSARLPTSPSRPNPLPKAQGQIEERSPAPVLRGILTKIALLALSASALGMSNHRLLENNAVRARSVSVTSITASAYVELGECLFDGTIKRMTSFCRPATYMTNGSEITLLPTCEIDSSMLSMDRHTHRSNKTSPMVIVVSRTPDPEGMFGFAQLPAIALSSAKAKDEAKINPGVAAAGSESEIHTPHCAPTVSTYRAQHQDRSSPTDRWR